MSHQPPSSAEAASAVAASTPPALASTRDRRVHGAAVTTLAGAVGVMTGLVLGIWNSEMPWRGLINTGIQWAFLAALFGVVLWRERAVRTWPRHTRRTALAGLTATAVLSLAVTTPVYLAGLPAPAPWVAVVVAIVVALPGVVAGTVIARGAR